MTWGQEILRAFLLVLGCTEIITNLTHLVKKGGLKNTRKQHGELPAGISDKNIKVKVVCMLIVGTALFTTALSSYILHSYTGKAILIASILFSVYGIIEALYYKYWKTFGFAGVTIALLLFSIIV